MADGGQAGFNFPQDLPTPRLLPGEIAVDLFAGGGGASVALERALQRPVDIAINHDALAVGMHAANHPFTRHLREDIWEADPRELVGGRPVGWLHASPDCTHFSQARGSQPRDRKIRSLTWVVVKWIGTLHAAGLAPRHLSLENVEQILKWGPLIAKRDHATGRVVTLDEIVDPQTGKKTHRVADPGERVPLKRQALVPDKRHMGRTWDQFVAIMRGFGYDVEWKRVVAADHGAGTSRKRLFLVARRDGKAINWPEPSHGPGRALPYVAAAEFIDWTDLGVSIFMPKAEARKLGVPRPLVDKTMRRIAHGIKRYVIDASEPFFLPGFLTEHANGSRQAVWSAHEPLRTQCAQPKGGHFALVGATLVPGPGHPEALAPADEWPGPSVISAILAGVGGRAGDSNPRSVADPCYTTTSKADCAVVSAKLQAVGSGLEPEHEAGALRVAAFLIRYYGQGGQWSDLREPLDTITTRDRIALVTVHIRGMPYVIVDITLRMLKPAELYRAQGFPAGYIIDRTADGRALKPTDQVRMVGNSVSPPPLFAIVDANLEPAAEPLRLAA